MGENGDGEMDLSEALGGVLRVAYSSGEAEEDEEGCHDTLVARVDGSVVVIQADE